MTEILERPFEEFDLIIVGGGPAGLFCAINSSIEGKRIILIEKMGSPGRKLLISGLGRCNISHDGEIRAFLDRYGDAGRFLRPALLGFSNDDLISTFDGLGLSMIRTYEGKVFPETLRSRDVLDLLLDLCSAKGIVIRCDQEVRSIARSEIGFEVFTRERYYKSALLLLSTGGRSYPATGSTGDGFEFSKGLGHNIVDTGPALTPVYIRDHPFKDLAGISFQEISIALFRGRKKIERSGDVLFTHGGLSGPGILDLSRHIRPGDTLKLSFLPSLERGNLESLIIDRAKAGGDRFARHLLADLSLPSRFISRILDISGIPNDLKSAQLTREMRRAIVENLTGFSLEVERLGGYDEAMVTRGGVDRREVDPRTMESRLVDGLYLAGEVLDIDGDSGGYNLQAAFSTGMLAARSIKARWTTPRARSSATTIEA